MLILVAIYKERKEKDYRMIIVPSGRSKIGIGQMKDYGIISYLGKGEEEKIGEFVLWALEQSDNMKIENASEIKFEKLTLFKISVISFFKFKHLHYLRSQFKS